MKVTYQKAKYNLENTLALKRLHVHFTLSGGLQLKIVDNGINGSETTVCSYTEQ